MTTPELREELRTDIPQCDLEWESLSAYDIVERFEQGIYDGDVIIKAGNYAEARPLRYFIRELVWESRVEPKRVDLKTHPDQLYFTIVDQAPIPTALSDLGGRLTYVNQAFCDFVGYERNELIGMTVGQLSVSDDHIKERDQGNVLFSGRQNGFRMEKRYLRKSGEERSGSLSISLLQDVEGQPTSVMAQIFDLTEIKTIQRELMQAQAVAVAGRLAQGITHDLKNILMVLKGTLDLLQNRQEPLDLEEQELIKGGVMVCESGHRLVRSLLDLQTEPQFTVIDLSDLYHRWDHLLPRFVAPYALSISLESGGSFYGDQDDLDRALMNLCMNAKQALQCQSQRDQSRHGEVHVRLKLTHASDTSEESALEIKVSDTGSGISSGDLRHISKPYFTTRSDDDGHGLGLAVVWATCHRHGGTLEIESELGSGSSFTLKLPCREDKSDLQERSQ